MKKCWHPLYNYVLKVKNKYIELSGNTTCYNFNEMLDYLYTNCSNVVFTANTEQIEKVKTIPELRAIMDRLRSMAKFISFQGKSMRG